MSYYITVNAFTFKSVLCPEDLECARRKHGASLPELVRSWFTDDNGGYLFEKIFEDAGEGYEYGLLMADYCYKSHVHADSELADFIAEVIKPGTYAIITFTGEEDNKWGYLVFHKKVHEIEYVGVVDGVNVHDFIRNRMEKGE